MKKWSGFHIRWNRKVWTLVGVGLLLCGAVAANILIGAGADGQAGQQAAGQDEDAVSAGASGAQGFFAAFRADRDTTREKEIDYLDAIIEQGADQQTLSDAQQQKLDIVNNME